jgi:heterodisulfide reductase subunit A-like polyferredoxin
VRGDTIVKLQQEDTTSVWMETAQIPDCPTLSGDLNVDVCIVGAGMAGLTTAYLLSQEGCRVAVLEARQAAAGQSRRTTAHLTNAHDDFYSEIEKVHGEDGMRIAAESHTTAIDVCPGICSVRPAIHRRSWIASSTPLRGLAFRG